MQYVIKLNPLVHHQISGVEQEGSSHRCLCSWGHNNYLELQFKIGKLFLYNKEQDPSHTLINLIRMLFVLGYTLPGDIPQLNDVGFLKYILTKNDLHSHKLLIWYRFELLSKIDIREIKSWLDFKWRNINHQFKMKKMTSYST